MYMQLNNIDAYPKLDVYHITIDILDYQKYFMSTSLRSDFELLDLYFIDLATSVTVFQAAKRS